MKKVKVNPLIRVFDAIRDEKLDCIIGQNEWCEVKESDWKRLKESKTKQGDVMIPTFIAEDEGMGEIQSVVSENEANDEVWFDGDDEVVVEEE